MDRFNFDIKIKEIAKRNSVLFELESDQKADDESLCCIENYYKVRLPDDYKYFLKQYGGGYFGFIVIFSCDENGMFYIKDHVCDEWIKNKSFLPVMDFETGDYAGFKVNGGICENEILLYSHEQDELLESADDFFDCILKYGFNQN